MILFVYYFLYLDVAKLAQRRRRKLICKSSQLLIFVFSIIIILIIIGPVSQAKIITAWLFDEGTGKVVKDDSGNGYDGEITGGKWIDGKFGKALEFDISTFVEVKDTKGVFNLSKNLTVMTWAYNRHTPNLYWYSS